MDRGAERCHHCGAANAALRARAGGDAEHAFCCAGCVGAAELIESLKLGEYYRVRAGFCDTPDATADHAHWDAPALLDRHAQTQGAWRGLSLGITGLRCAACAWLIEHALRREAGVHSVHVDAASARLRVHWDPERTRPSVWIALLARLGYGVHLPGTEHQHARRERRTQLKRLAVAGLGAMQAMMFAEALYFGEGGGMDFATRDFFRWLTMFASAPVVFYAGWPFLRGAWHEWRMRWLGMDTLVAICVLLAFGASIVETVRGGPHVYFDAASMFVFLLLTARVVEQAARARGARDAAGLARAQPSLAQRVDADDRGTWVAVAQLALGDRVRVAVGDAVPADAELLDARAEFDLSLLSGESAPVLYQQGEYLPAGAVCVGSATLLRVRALGADTALSQMQRLADRAAGERPQWARLADTVAARFVTALLACALINAIAWSFIDATHVLPTTLAVLAAACPCALALAVPAALAAAQQRMARLGVLPCSADGMAKLAGIEVMAFDKTGTLTQGKPALADVSPMAELDRAQCLAIAAALERDVRHPLARAFAAHDGGLPCEDVHYEPGVGVRGRIGADIWRLGRDLGDAEALALTRGDQIVARFRVHDPLRADAVATCASLRAADIELALYSGDAPSRARAVAHTLAIDDAQGGLMPADKLARVRARQAAGARVAMVGDGINDAAVLAGADVSLAMAEGAALAQTRADFVLLNGGLSRIPQALRLARATRAIMVQNLSWAAIYNACALPFAAVGWLTPGWAALGMCVSSLAVTLNALRLRRWSPTTTNDAAPTLAPMRGAA